MDKEEDEVEVEVEEEEASASVGAIFGGLMTEFVDSVWKEKEDTPPLLPRFGVLYMCFVFVDVEIFLERFMSTFL